MDKNTYFFCITKYFNKNFNIELDKILFFPSFESLYCILFLRQQATSIARTCGKVETNRTVFILCVAMTWPPFLFVLHGNFACFALQFRPIYSPILPKLLSVLP